MTEKPQPRQGEYIQSQDEMASQRDDTYVQKPDQYPIPPVNEETMLTQRITPWNLYIINTVDKVRNSLWKLRLKTKGLLNHSAQVIANYSERFRNLAGDAAQVIAESNIRVPRVDRVTRDLLGEDEQ